MKSRTCDTHDQKVQVICCLDHDCQMRLQCIKCMKQHYEKYQSQQPKEVEEFQADVLKDLEGIQNTYSFNQIISEISIMIEQLINQIPKQLKLIYDRLMLLVERVEQIGYEHQELRDLLEKSELLQLPDEIINKLVDNKKFQQNLADKQIEKDEAFQSLNKVISQFKKNNDDYLHQQNKLICETIITEEFQYQGQQVKLVGGNIVGIKDGNFNYEIDDCFEFAGKYILNQKHGVWKEFVLIDGEMKPQFFEYQNGSKKNLQDKQYICFDNEWEEINKVNDSKQKIGYWRESFNNNKQSFEGNYIEGKQVGRWHIKQNNIEIGGGDYESGVKVGLWREPGLNYDNVYQLLLEGYYKDNKKIGKWVVLFKKPQEEEFEQIGFRQYGNQGDVIVKQRDIDENFRIDSQILYEGVIENMKKIGDWIIYYRGPGQQQFQQIGGGFYDKEGNKDGAWKEQCENFSDNLQIIYETNYFNNKKNGKQTILFRQYSQDQFDEIGGGEYSSFGQKQGKWIELWENFGNNKQVIFQGQYTSNKREGRWKILYREKYFNEFVEIGGGIYSSMGRKQGFWREISDSFSNDNQIILEGQYSNGEKLQGWKQDNLNNMSNPGLFVC